MKEDLIAPCGMNCSLCISYQFYEKDLNKFGFHRRYCPGCIPRGKNCTFLKNKCEFMKSGTYRFCFLCTNYPCKALKTIDNRYRSKYGMSMIENLNFIKENNLETFLIKEKNKWKCHHCSSYLCCHNNLCLNCNLDKIIIDKKFNKRNEKIN